MHIEIMSVRTVADGRLRISFECAIGSAEGTWASGEIPKAGDRRYVEFDLDATEIRQVAAAGISEPHYILRQGEGILFQGTIEEGLESCAFIRFGETIATVGSPVDLTNLPNGTIVRGQSDEVRVYDY